MNSSFSKFLWSVWCFFVSLCQLNEITLYHKIQNLSRFYWLSSRQLHCSFLIHVECLNTTAISVLYRHIDRFWHWFTKQAVFKGSNCRISKKLPSFRKLDMIVHHCSWWRKYKTCGINIFCDSTCHWWILLPATSKIADDIWKTVDFLLTDSFPQFPSC